VSFRKAFRNWREKRKAKKEAEKRFKLLAARAHLEQTNPRPSVLEPESPTGIFNTVKATLDKATDQKRKARTSAQRIIKSGEDEKE
jgi:hypothetical protein